MEQQDVDAGDGRSGPLPCKKAGRGEDSSVLVVSNHGNATKIQRHWGPLAEVATDVTMVCVETHPGVEGIEYRSVPSPYHRLVGIGAMFFAALEECARDDYDAIAAISLFPYGWYTLVLGRIFGLPIHLGIIGIDLDYHADAWYGPVVRHGFRRFSSLSVPGTAHERRLVEMGVDPRRITILANAINVGKFRPTAGPSSPEHDFVWVGRCTRAKNPLLFVRGLAELRSRDIEFSAVLVGDGPLAAAVERERTAHDLESHLSLVGWVDDPLEYYARARVYVLTSRRDALPLTLLEAMATGTPPIVPDVGSVRDPVKHRETGYVVEKMTPETLADALETVQRDDELRTRLATAAPAVRESYSYEAAREDWRRILTVLADS